MCPNEYPYTNLKKNILNFKLKLKLNYYAYNLDPLKYNFAVIWTKNSGKINYDAS